MKSAPLDIVNIYHHYFPEDQIFNVLSQLDPLIDYLYKYDYDNLDEWRESNHNRFTCMVGKNPCYFTLHEIPGGYQWVWQYYTPTTKSSDVSYADIPRELVEDMFNIITILLFSSFPQKTFHTFPSIVQPCSCLKQWNPTISPDPKHVLIIGLKAHPSSVLDYGHILLASSFINAPLSDLTAIRCDV